jgi:hypothetical protein
LLLLFYAVGWWAEVLVISIEDNLVVIKLLLLIVHYVG